MIEDHRRRYSRNYQPMKRSTIIVFLLAVLLGWLAVHSLRHTRNDWYEFCTTQAFGWPFAWQIDHCLCDGEGGLTEHPVSSFALNSGIVLVFGLTASGLYGAFGKLRKC